MTDARRAWLIVAGLTVLAAVLRLRWMGSSLFGDEFLTYRIISLPDVRDMLHRLVQEPESTPPLQYTLAWLTGKISGAVSDVRIPSVVAGVSLVPALFAVGRRLAGERVALVAAALMALDPFAIFYATETRAYALASLLVVLAALVLLRALDRPSVWRLVLLGVVLAAAAYTHYSLIFALAVLVGWAVWTRPDRRGRVLIACAGAVLLYIPWLPHLHGRALALITAYFPLTFLHVLEGGLRATTGLPFTPIPTVPGALSLILLGEALLLALAGPALLQQGARERLARAPHAALLVGALALATPVGLLLYRLVSGTDLYYPRNLIASQPFALLGLAWIAAAAPRRLRAPAIASLVAAFAVAGAGTLRSSTDRPALVRAAAVINAERAPGDPVIAVPLLPSGGPSLHDDLLVYLHRGTRYTEALPPRTGAVPQVSAAAWRGGRVFVGGRADQLLPQPPARAGWRVVERHRWAGIVPYALVVWQRPGG